MIAARCFTLGEISAPLRSAEISRVARPVAIANLNTIPQILRSRRALSYRPLSSNLRKAVSSSSAVTSATDLVPNASKATSKSHRFLVSVVCARPSIRCFSRSSSATARNVFSSDLAAILSSLRWAEGLPSCPCLTESYDGI